MSATAPSTTQQTAPTAAATAGLHHVTIFASDPARNIDFYTRVLGLRLVKKTVNFDDPGTYHLYYGDQTGAPGTALTFFPWPGAARSPQGSGAVTATAFAVPPGSLSQWHTRLSELGVTIHGLEQRLGESVLRFEDHDGTQLELVQSPGAEALPAWTGGGVPAQMAIRGFFGVTLSLRTTEHTARMLTDHLGMTPGPAQGNRRRFTAPGGGPLGTVIDLLHTPDLRPARPGAGTVHHVAVRAADDRHQSQLAGSLRRAGFAVTDVRDRFYFRSVYYRERGGVLFEIATDGPGFATDEPADALGAALMLPPAYEHLRREIESALPPIAPPGVRSGSSVTADDYQHVFVPAQGDTTGRWLLLLHGTGGDEHDLLPLGRKLLPGAAMLSPRGDINENGQLRFFKRFAEGVFDPADVQRAAAKLRGWVAAAALRYGLDPARGTAVGFSNGANVLGAAMLTGAPPVGRAVLIRAMQTARPEQGVSLSGLPVLLLSGDSDPIVPPDNAQGLARQLTAAGALVRHVRLPVGHTLAPGDLAEAVAFVNQPQG